MLDQYIGLFLYWEGKQKQKESIKLVYIYASLSARALSALMGGDVAQCQIPPFDS